LVLHGFAALTFILIRDLPSPAGLFGYRSRKHSKLNSPGQEPESNLNRRGDFKPGSTGAP
jgi:hypothetical protein